MIFFCCEHSLPGSSGLRDFVSANHFRAKTKHKNSQTSSPKELHGQMRSLKSFQKKTNNSDMGDDVVYLDARRVSFDNGDYARIIQNRKLESRPVFTFATKRTNFTNKFMTLYTELLEDPTQVIPL